MVNVDNASTHNGGDRIVMEKRERIRLLKVDGDRNRMNEMTDAVLVWFDSKALDGEREGDAIMAKITDVGFTGIVLYATNFAAIAPRIPGRMQVVLHLEDAASFDALSATPEFAQAKDQRHLVIGSASTELLAIAREAGFATCVRAYVDGGDSLHDSIRMGAGHSFLMVRFRDPTNIPLELVIASLQASHTVLVKEISDPTDVDDAIVTLGVMEVGADGVMFSPTKLATLGELMSRLAAREATKVKIEAATVIRSEPIGMGTRSCIDVATLFEPTEGMIVGSTSQGGILCCPEVYFLPYMELRPFRVNAGAVHSYVYNVDNRTDYMSELRAGSSIMIVDSTGSVRRAPVGRMKTEVRPVRLIEAEFATGERVNVIMQDDWHVRIFSADAKPLNITSLKPGDKILAHLAKPGRHVGIAVDEHINET
jgi:3-dehydroquinate synthase II/3-amino-4-hydroxybenzoic acid synthase